MSEEEKPTAAFVLSLIGGIIALVVGGLFLFASSIIYGYSFFYGYYSIVISIIGIWELVSGVIIIVGASELNSHPERHSQWGAVILIFAIIGGGGCLALIGGILALAWKPPAAAAPSGARARRAVGRVCPQCGTVLEEDVKFCPSCGWSVSGRKTFEQ